MALANLAFLAAMNGKRVLVMDWDLEAPGLSYYFRGQLDATQAKQLKDAPGILDIVWEWSQAVSEAKGAAADGLIKRYESGTPYADCVRPLLASYILPNGAALDFIGAGSKLVSSKPPRRYEEALAEFSWTDFLNQKAGGIVLDTLRSWAKNNYDLVLLDSRTGMADVAGICTMQLPDVVALCFIFNRQNIDGVAKIAGAIRTEREEKIVIRALPMRISRAGTPEEADARARALNELTGQGGFSANAVKEDFQTLAIAQADSVPFYETLAPFAAQNPKLDLLTLNYLSMGESLLGLNLKIPDIDAALVEVVRRRLMPRHATSEYLNQLNSLHPERVAVELELLIESAIEATISGESLEDEYLNALVNAALGSSEPQGFDGQTSVQSQALDLLRELNSRNSIKWQPILIHSIERYLDIYSSMLDGEHELLLLEELDGLIAKSNTTNARLRRIEHRRRAASLYMEEQNHEATMQTVGEIFNLLDRIPNDPPLARDQTFKIFTARIDAELQTGAVDLAKGKKNEAYKNYARALEQITRRPVEMESDVERAEFATISYRLYSTLALEFDLDSAEAARFAIQSAQTGRTAAVMNFNRLAAIVLIPRIPLLVLSFLNHTIAASEYRRQRVFPNYFGRQVKPADALTLTLLSMVKAIGPLPTDDTHAPAEAVAETVAFLLDTISRRRATVSSQAATHLMQTVFLLVDLLIPMRVSPLLIQRITSAANNFAKVRRNVEPSTGK